MPNDEMLTYPRAAVLLGVPVGTLYAWVHQGRVPHVRFGRRAVRFKRSALERWVETHQVAVTVAK